MRGHRGGAAAQERIHDQTSTRGPLLHEVQRRVQGLLLLVKFLLTLVTGDVRVIPPLAAHIRRLDEDQERLEQVVDSPRHHLVVRSGAY